MQKHKFTRLFLVPTLAFSLATGAVAPIVANAQPMDDASSSTSQTAPKQKVRLAKITSVDGTHYTAETLEQGGHGRKDMQKPLEENSDTELDTNNRPEPPQMPSDGSFESERSDTPPRDGEHSREALSEDEREESSDNTNPFKNLLPDGLKDMLGFDSEDDVETDSERPQRNGFKPFNGDIEDKENHGDFKNLEDFDDESERPFRNLEDHPVIDEETTSQTIEFDAENQDLAVNDIVALTFDGDTVTNVEKLDKDAILRKHEHGLRGKAKQQSAESTNDIDSGGTA